MERSPSGRVRPCRRRMADPAEVGDERSVWRLCDGGAHQVRVLHGPTPAGTLGAAGTQAGAGTITATVPLRHFRAGCRRIR